jgi:ASC-1-like (ASCH) protein
MSKEMREQIDNFKNFLLNEGKSVNFTENQKRLREYIKILKENYDLGFDKDNRGNFNKFDLYIKYFIVLHNFLFLENRYFDAVKLSNKEINKYLNLPKLESLDEVIEKFNELYDTNSNVRFGVETLDSIEEIRLLLPKLKDFFSKVYKSFNVGG